MTLGREPDCRLLPTRRLIRCLSEARFGATALLRAWRSLPTAFLVDANPFLQSVHRGMTSRLLQLPDKHSVTALLNTWAQSIHQACLSAA